MKGQSKTKIVNTICGHRTEIKDTIRVDVITTNKSKQEYICEECARKWVD